jgi:thioredoxin:protein disulfide reductase
LYKNTDGFFWRNLLVLLCINTLGLSALWGQPAVTSAAILLAKPVQQPLNYSTASAGSETLATPSANVFKQNNAVSSEPLAVEKAFSLSANRQGGVVSIQFLVADGYYLYKDKLSIKLLGSSTLFDLALPEGKIKYDETFAKNVETYRNKLIIPSIQTSASFSDSLVIDVYSQGCADIGICYPPQLQRLTFTPNKDDAVVSMLEFVPNTGITTTQQVQTNAITVPAQGGNLASAWFNVQNPFALALAFIGFGLLLSFTPCVLPMLPIVSSIVLGRNGGKTLVAGSQPTSAFDGFKLSFAYVLGMCITYTLIGVLAGLAGSGLSAFLQHPVLLGLFGVLMVVLAGAQFGWYELSLPASWMVVLGDKQNKAGQRRYIGVILMGALSAIMVGPCVTAPLAGALAYIAQTGNAWTGGLALFSLAFGMGIPLLLIGAGGARWLPKTGAWMGKVTDAFGIMLLCVAIWTVQSLLPQWVVVILWVLMLLLFAEMLGALHFSQQARPRLSGLAQLIGLLCLVWAAAVVWGMASGRFDVVQPLSNLGSNSAASDNLNKRPKFAVISAEAVEQSLVASSGKPIILDVYADWCISCVEFERFTFSDTKVSTLLEQFTLLKADVTKNTFADQALLKKLKLFGPPAIVFYSSQGKEIEGARVIGFQDAVLFSEHLKRVLSLNR